MTTEIELKLSYAGTDWESLTRRVSHSNRLGPFELGPTKTVNCRDVYWDTNDCLLRRQLACLRMRNQDGRRSLCLKSRPTEHDGLFARDEFEVALAEPGWAEMAARLRDFGVLIDPELLGQLTEPTPVPPLVPLLVTFSRRLFVPAFERGRPVVHLTMDTITYRSVDREFHDVELELVPCACPSVLDRFAALLEELEPGAWRRATDSKLVRGLKLVGIITS